MQDLKLGSQTLTEYMKSFKNVFDGLVAIQKPVYEEDKVIYLSKGFGKKYSVLLTSLRTYTQFVIAVHNHELHL